MHIGDCRAVLPTLPDGSVHCVVTSPPYWGLRDYGTAAWDGGDPTCDHTPGVVPVAASDPGIRRSTLEGGKSTTTAQAAARSYRERCADCGARRIDRQIGLEPTPEAYLATMIEVFREVRRVLRDDGTLWMNMGDGYAGGKIGNTNGLDGSTLTTGTRMPRRIEVELLKGADVRRGVPEGFKPKDLVGMPWRLAFALQADGWFLRSDIIWAKPNPMPESVTDRPTKAHEYIFLLSKQARYFYDAEALREPSAFGTVERFGNGGAPRLTGKAYDPGRHARLQAELLAGRNARTVWTICSEPYPEAHFATFPAELARRCILAGTSAKGACGACGSPWERLVVGETTSRRDYGSVDRYVDLNNGRAGDRRTETVGWRSTCAHDAPRVPCRVLDPFAGSGTVGEVAERNGRHAVLIELSPTYGDLIRERTAQRCLFAPEEARAVSLQ